MDISVEKLVYGGDGLARVNGQVVLAPFVLPGETARIEVESEKKGLIRAGHVEILQSSPDRVAAPCPYFTRCGGCHYQHAPYDRQLELKREIVREEMRRLGKIEPPEEIAIISGEPWSYRNRSQLHIRGAELGYLEARSHKLCAIEMCPISSPKINQIIATLRDMLRDDRWPRFVRSVEIFTNEEQVQFNVLETDRPVARRFFDWCGERIPNMVGTLDYPVDGVSYRVSAQSFFQVNRYLAGRLVEVALEGVAGESALDLYAGVGLFSLPLANRFRHVTAVESGSAAVRDLLFNAERARVAVGVEQNGVDAYLKHISETPDFVLLDPPRAGIGRQVVAELARLKPPHIAIVACDPATLARDLAGLLAVGYSIDQMTLVDLFPQTYHIETVVRLKI